MSVVVEFEQSRLVIIRVNDELKVDEFARAGDQLQQRLNPSEQVDILILLERFNGWENSDGWEGQSFSETFDQQLRRMAIVGDPCWEDQALLFSAKGLRPVEIEFFATVEEEKARRWLLQRATSSGG